MSDISLNKNSCAFKNCNKKLKLTNFPCKCGKKFCKYHIIPEDHKCSYDYKDENNKKKKIEELKCVSNKLEKI